MQRTSLEATSQTSWTGDFSLHTLWQNSHFSPGYVLFWAVVGGMSHLLSVGWKQSGLLHGNQHQASPRQGHARLTREKHTENFKRAIDILDKSNTYYVEPCLLLNSRLVERNTSTEIIKMPCTFPQTQCPMVPGEGKGSPESSVFPSLDVHSRKTVPMYHPRIRGLLTSLLPPGYLSHIKNTGNVYVFSYHPWKALYYNQAL